MKSLFLILITINAFGFIQKNTFDDNLDITWNYKALAPVSESLTSIEYKIYSALKNSDAQQTINIFTEAKLKRPFKASVYFNMGEALFREKQYPRSIEFFRTFIAIFKSNKNRNLALLRIGQLSERLSLPRYLAVESYQQVIQDSLIKKEVKEAKLRLFGADYLRNINKPLSSKNILNSVKSELNVDESKLLELKWILRIQSLYGDWSLEKALEYVETIPVNQIENSDKFNRLINEIYLEKMSNLFSKKKYRKLLNLARSYENKSLNSKYNQKIRSLIRQSRKIAVSDILEKNKG